VELPERKSQTIFIAIRKCSDDLKELQEKHKMISNKLISKTSEVMKNGGNLIEIVKTIEDLEFEMVNNILLGIESAFETLEGFEIEILDVDPYLPILKDEKELLQDLTLSVKNLVKMNSSNDETLTKQEKDNLKFLYESYKRISRKTQKNIEEIFKLIQKQLKKIKKLIP